VTLTGTGLADIAVCPLGDENFTNNLGTRGYFLHNTMDASQAVSYFARREVGEEVVLDLISHLVSAAADELTERSIQRRVVPYVAKEIVHSIDHAVQVLF